ncbi:uncharacterized protein [Haliotis asinina]|uniref:uncharacterized protein n=1 Tax=Haliotis asinina TaxID=109174 RepID=UPI003531FA03
MRLRIALAMALLLCLAASEDAPPKVAALEDGHRLAIDPHTPPVSTYTAPGAPVEKSPAPFASPPPPKVYNKAVRTHGNVDHVVTAEDVGVAKISGSDPVPPPAAPVSAPVVTVSASAVPVSGKAVNLSVTHHDSRLPEAQIPVKAHSDTPKAERQYSSTGNSVSFSSSDGDGPGKKQCSFSVSTPNTYHASSDGFGYPTFMVEGAFNDNQLAKDIFTKYLGHPNTGLNLPGVSAADRHIQIPNFGGNHVDGLSSLGDQVNHGEPHGFDVNGMFNQIGKSVDNNNIGGFQHAPPQFPDNVIQPGRGFSFGGGLRSRDPFSNFGGLPFRKRREAIPPGLGGNEVKSVCPFTSEYIQSFKKYNSVCFVYKPKVQGLKVAKCGQEQCSQCGTKAGKCVAEQMSGWLWAYCQEGPSARKLSFEYIEYPAYCVCKTITC